MTSKLGGAGWLLVGGAAVAATYLVVRFAEARATQTSTAQKKFQAMDTNHDGVIDENERGAYNRAASQNTATANSPPAEATAAATMNPAGLDAFALHYLKTFVQGWNQSSPNRRNAFLAQGTSGQANWRYVMKGMNVAQALNYAVALGWRVQPVDAPILRGDPSR
jgi:hypothetical protein